MGSITVSNLGKAYKQYPNRWSRLAEWLDPNEKPHHQLKWILQNINFTVNAGEAVGVVGVNGAGKSTLLKMIAGISTPTTGAIHISGRVVAMLELGMGFLPDFTGRDNVKMAAQLLGLSPEEVDALMPEIEKFADVGDYFDQPCRVYSSGMMARVAFSVATSIQPDILIVDEVLSVGDMAFQSKCMQRMTDLLEGGTTILLVSHALNQIRQFCDKALYIAQGRVKEWGSADKVCDVYQNDLVGVIPPNENTGHLDGEVNITHDVERDPNLRKNSIGGGAGGSLDLEFLNFKILDKLGQQTSSFRPGDTIKFQISILANANVDAGANIGILFADKSGYPIMACNTNYYDKFLPPLQKGEIVFVEILVINPFSLGEFRLDVGIKPEPFSQSFFDRIFCVATLSIVPDARLLKRNFGGYLYASTDITFSVIKK
jgi:lipopolysaccharide transport system ATP-binding protein